MAGRAGADVAALPTRLAQLADCLHAKRASRPTDHFPPEPLRYLAGRIVRAGVARRERAEHEGREPSWLDKRLAKLAPATVTDVFGRRSA